LIRLDLRQYLKAALWPDLGIDSFAGFVSYTIAACDRQYSIPMQIEPGPPNIQQLSALAVVQWIDGGK
jgi:hypothetical protein